MGVFNKFSVDGGATFQEIEDENGRKMLAPIETDATSASKAYAVGEFLSLESTGKLYKVTAAIASGSAIITTGSGANVTEDTVGGEIKSVKDNYTSKNLLTDTLRDAEVIEGGNLCPFDPYTGTVGNVACTSKNGSVLVLNGACNANVWIGISANGSPNDGVNSWASLCRFKLKAGSYVLFSSIPKSSLTSQHAIGISDGTNMLAYYYDEGNNVFTLSQDTYVFVAVRCQSGVTYTNDEIDACIKTVDEYTDDPSYAPYYEPLKDRKLDITDAQVLGAWNLAQNNGTTQTLNGATFTKNADDTVTVNVSGSAVTATTKYILSSTTDVYVPLPDKLKPGETYYLSGCTGGNYSGTDGGSDTFFLWINFRDSDNEYLGNVICSKAEKAFTIPANATQYEMGINIYAAAGKLTGKVFSPMISLQPNQPYVPPVMTNRELTNAVNTKQNKLKTIYSAGTAELSENITTIALSEDYRHFSLLHVLLSDSWGNQEVATFRGSSQGHKNAVIVAPSVNQDTKILRLRHEYTEEVTAGMSLCLKLQQISGSAAINLFVPLKVSAVIGEY